MASRFGHPSQRSTRVSSPLRANRSLLSDFEDEPPSRDDPLHNDDDQSRRQRASAVSAFVDDFVKRHTSGRLNSSVFSSSAATCRPPIRSGALPLSSRTSSRPPSHTRERPPHIPEYDSSINMSMCERDRAHLVLRQARDENRAVAGSVELAPLRAGLGHLRHAYEEAQLHCETLITDFDAATERVRMFAGSKAICHLWHDFLREERDSSVGIDAKLSSVRYCLVNLDQQRERVALPKEFDKLVSQTVKVGHEIVKLSGKAKSDRRAVDRLISNLRAASADADPNSDANRTLFLELDPLCARSGKRVSKKPALFDEQEESLDNSKVVDGWECDMRPASP